MSRVCHGWKGRIIPCEGGKMERILTNQMKLKNDTHCSSPYVLFACDLFVDWRIEKMKKIEKKRRKKEKENKREDIEVDCTSPHARQHKQYIQHNAFVLARMRPSALVCVARVLFNAIVIASCLLCFVRVFSLSVCT